MSVPAETLRGKRNDLYRLALLKITVRSRPSDTPARPLTDLIHVDNIGIISNTLHDLDGDVYDYPDETYDTDGADYGYGELAWPPDRRARAVALVLGGVVALGAIGTAVIINSGDSATTKATLGAPVPTVTSTPRTVAPSATPTPSRQPLPSETVTTVPPDVLPELGLTAETVGGPAQRTLPDGKVMGDATQKGGGPINVPQLTAPPSDAPAPH